MSFNEKAAAAFLDGKETAFNEKAAADFLDQKEPEKEPEIIAPPQSGIDEIISGANRFAAGANDVLLSALGLPGDAMNFVLEKMGAENRVYGSEAIRGVGAKLGIGYEKGQEPDSALYKAGEYTGIGLAFLAPILKYGEGALTAVKGGQIVEPSVGVAKGVAQRITAPFVTAPKTALTGELAGSFGAGMGAFYGEREYGPTGEVIGGLVGGVPSALVATAVPRLTQSVKKSLFPFMSAGAKPKAAARIQALAETPRTAKIITEAQAKVLPEARIPPAKLAGDRHLLALHNKVLETDPVLSHKMRLEQQATNALARKEIEKLGGDVPIEETQAYLQGRINHIKGLINSRVDQALIKARDSLDELNPKMQRNVVNKTVNTQINAALSEARKVENEAWAKVDKNAFASTEKVKSVYQKILSERAPTEDPTEIPAFLNEWLGTVKKGIFRDGKLGRTETVKNLHGLRSRITTTVREEKGKEVPNWNKVRILNQIQESILDDLQASPAAKNFDEALQVSRTLNEKFRGGVIDIILGHEKTGGKIAPEISLESIRGGPKAAVQIKEVLAASPESFGMTEELIKLNIQQSGIVDKNGRIIPSAAKKYLLKNEDVLDIFPDVKKALDQAIGIEENVRRTISTAKARTGILDASTAQKITKAKPGRVMSTIMSDKNPAQKMRSIFKQSNNIGKKGIKNDIVDFLLGKSKTGKFDEHDMPILSGQKMANAWKTNKNVLKEGLDQPEIKRLETIIETLKKNDELGELPDIGEIISPANKLINFIVGTAAARAGAQLGAGTSGASLRTASMATRTAQKIVDSLDVGRAQQIIKDAIQDPELFKTLLTETTKGPELLVADKVIQGWMLAHTVSSLEETAQKLKE